MIPICRAPKRFVAALNKERFAVRTKTTARARKYGLFSVPQFVSSLALNDVTTAKSHKLLSTMPAIGRTNDEIAATVVERNETTRYQDSMNLTGPRNEDWYTGKLPKLGMCPGMSKDGYLYSLPQIAFTNGTFTKQQLQDYFDNTWTLTEVLMASLQGEEAFMRPPYHDLRHPMIFYYGHPAVLYVNKLRVAGLLKDPVNPYFESIFETGVDEMSWDDLSKNRMPWPSVAEVHQYRKTVYNLVTKLIAELTEDQLSSVNKKSPLWALLMGFEHERIHIETSSFLINEMPLPFVRRPEHFPPYHPTTPTRQTEVISPIKGKDYPVNEMVCLPSQTVTIGKPENFPSFGWDNEYGARSYTVPSFAASKYKISNGEFLEFVKDGGYARLELWTEVGWKWRAFRNVKWPTFWLRKGPQGHHDYDLRLIFDIVPMPWDWPVVINYHEAQAFAKWKSLQTGKSYRILTELEHRAMRETSESTEEGKDMALLYSGEEMTAKTGYNLNLAYASMSPVHAFPPNSKGFHDVFGNAWEWTEDYFAPLPGFTVHPYYEDFSTPCFDGLHHIIQGGSFISTGNEASIHARFHFRPHFYQHASCRLVESDASQPVTTSDTDAPGPYVGNYPFRRSSSALLAQGQATDAATEAAGFVKDVLLARHFGTAWAPFALPGMTGLTQVIREHIQTVRGSGVSNAKVLEVGCGVGGMTFALAAEGASVMGVDHSLEAIATAKELYLTQQAPQYTLAGEGHGQATFSTSLPTIPKHGKLDFRCADPMCLPAEMHGFDVVVLHDVIDKLSSPNALLGRLGGIRGLVSPGGCLIVISAYQWSANRTPESLWLGGHSLDQASTSEAGLITRLQADFTVVHQNVTVPVCWPTSTKDIQGKVYTVTCFARK